ncbi:MULTISPECIES: hypothetical protein [Mesotoga]|nr:MULTISPECIES: hypothetical protein [Mesotoga]MCP5456970.1 hypothetical protein [Thermotogota bacterium]CCU84033.1 hypothetical protein PHOSAC3_120650 [Mesotoga infera]MCB1222535.1 hypothetical protein [Mesotoga sp.]MCP5460187.1 hypothetical protein [Thermotogota bacterium]MDK2944036.1 hypothetical protein [Mesotoga sp.]
MRNHRSGLREKARQAKTFLLFHEMMEPSVIKEDRIVDVRGNAATVDEQ